MCQRRNFLLTKPPMVFVSMKPRRSNLAAVADANDGTVTGDSDTVRVYASVHRPPSSLLSLPACHSLTQSRGSRGVAVSPTC